MIFIRKMSSLKKLSENIKTRVFLLYLCFKDKRTPLYAKAISILALALAFSPIDLIPDFIPVLGYLDDIIIIPLLVFIAFRLIPDVIISDNMQLAETLKIKSLPVFRKTGIAIVLVWITIILFLIYSIIKHVN